MIFFLWCLMIVTKINPDGHSFCPKSHPVVFDFFAMCELGRGFFVEFVNCVSFLDRRNRKKKIAYSLPSLLDKAVSFKGRCLLCTVQYLQQFLLN